MRTVVNQKCFVGIPVTEMRTQQGEHLVFWFNFCNQYTILLGKAEKAFEQMGFVV